MLWLGPYRTKEPSDPSLEPVRLASWPPAGGFRGHCWRRVRSVERRIGTGDQLIRYRIGLGRRLTHALGNRYRTTEPTQILSMACQVIQTPPRHVDSFLSKSQRSPCSEGLWQGCLSFHGMNLLSTIRVSAPFCCSPAGVVQLFVLFPDPGKQAISPTTLSLPWDPEM